MSVLSGGYLPKQRLPTPALHRLDSARWLLASLVMWVALLIASWTQSSGAAVVILIMIFAASAGVVIAAVFEIVRYSRAVPSIVVLVAGLIANPATLLVASGFALLITGNPAD